VANVVVGEPGIVRARKRFFYKTSDGREHCAYAAFPKQDRFHELRERFKYRFFGGAAGPGKTMALLWEAIEICHLIEDPEQARRVSTLLLRRTVPQLEGSLLREFRKLPRELYRDWHEQKKTVTWTNGATTRFGSMQYEHDAWAYQGHEYAFVGWDELTQFLLSQWRTLSAWNRCPVPGIPVGMSGAGNPIGIGAVWVRAAFVKRNPPPDWDRPSSYHPEEYAFVPALLCDNPVYASDAAYVATLEALPHRLREALLAGNWDVPIGAYFDVWDPAVHVVRAEEIGMETWWPRWMSQDWAFGGLCVTHWHTTAPDGRVYTYREYKTSQKGPEELAVELVERSIDRDGNPESINEFFVSPDAFAQRDSHQAPAIRLGEALRGTHIPAPAPAATDRTGGWLLMYEMLRGEPLGFDEEGRRRYGPPRWMIADSCPALIETLPLLPRDDHNVEDIPDLPGTDDPAESARYGLYTRLRAGRKPVEQRIREAMTAQDPTVREIQALLAEQRERKARGAWERKRRRR
jgi:hypothetical protein